MTSEFPEADRDILCAVGIDEIRNPFFRFRLFRNLIPALFELFQMVLDEGDQLRRNRFHGKVGGGSDAVSLNEESIKKLNFEQVQKLRHG